MVFIARRFREIETLTGLDVYGVQIIAEIESMTAVTDAGNYKLHQIGLCAPVTHEIWKMPDALAWGTHPDRIKS